MVRRVLQWVALVCVLAITTSCLTPVIPIPPPVAFAISTPCVDVDCTTESRVVHITGRARSGALVVAINRSRTLPDGRELMVSTFARTNNADAGSDGGTSDYNFDLDLLPVRIPGQPTVTTQAMDEIEIFALSSDPTHSTSDVRRSQSTFLVVPR